MNEQPYVNFETSKRKEKNTSTSIITEKRVTDDPFPARTTDRKSCRDLRLGTVSSMRADASALFSWSRTQARVKKLPYLKAMHNGVSSQVGNQ